MRNLSLHKPLVSLLIIFMLPGGLSAQCAMCRAVLESSDDNAVAEGINNGIIYLMAIPYVLIGVLLFFVIRKVRS